jgi:hypothetical protein
MINPRSLSRLCLLPPAIALLSCASLRQPLPTTSPFIRGTVASHCVVECSLGYLVVVEPDDRHRFAYDSAWVKVYPETRLAHADGRPAELSRLTDGTRVSVWTTPVVNESRPVQVVATVVVVEASDTP